MGGQRGFTLLELLVITVILAVLVTISLPNLLGGRINANETASIATARSLVHAQLSFQARKEADLNGNGLGEFGTFGEMSGNVAVRALAGGTRYLDPSVVNLSFGNISASGEMLRNGYYYRLYLPDAAGDGVTELAGGGAALEVDASNAEAGWCAYCWPQKYGTTGRRVFFVNHSGDVLYSENSRYDGPAAPIFPGAAFEGTGPSNHILGIPAANRIGRDGGEWKTVGRN